MCDLRLELLLFQGVRLPPLVDFIYLLLHDVLELFLVLSVVTELD